jgi:hypothetical protein
MFDPAKLQISKTVVGGFVHRGFESHPLRYNSELGHLLGLCGPSDGSPAYSLASTNVS